MSTATEQKRGLGQLLHSYFYWTYSRGSIHYDVMVTLILAFIFITPHLWNYGDKPSLPGRVQHPIEVVSNGERGMIVTVADADAQIDKTAANGAVKKALRKAIEPVTGDAVFVERWETVAAPDGTLAWKIWAHR